jgi:ABC-type dipeptide/oligopeptide/nickel transport system permease subunit
MGLVNQIVERILLIVLLIVPQLVETVFANQEKIVKTVVSIVQTQLAETEFVSLLVGKIHQIVRSIALQLVEMEFVKAERIPQIAA